MSSETQTMNAAQVLQTVAKMIPTAQKVAAEAKQRKAAAPKPVDPAALEKTAAVLVETGWISDAARKADVQATLADPSQALVVIQNLAQKSAEELKKFRGVDPRLTGGTPVSDGPTKVAAADDESEADRKYNAKLDTYRTGRAG